jgi:hypothetical protein
MDSIFLRARWLGSTAIYRGSESTWECQVRKLKVMADSQCHPLWDMSPGMYGDVDPNKLPISAELKQEFADWARAFDETLDPSDPARSGFRSTGAEAAFKAKGVQLAEQLQNELGTDFLTSVKA